jgi:hypothetical protein
VLYLWWKLRKMQKAMGGGSDVQWQGPPDPYSTLSPAPASYHTRDPRQKYELEAEQATYELQGQHYFVRGDASSTEMSSHPPYGVESPVVTR